MPIKLQHPHLQKGLIPTYVKSYFVVVTHKAEQGRIMAVWWFQLYCLVFFCLVHPTIKWMTIGSIVSDYQLHLLRPLNIRFFIAFDQNSTENNINLVISTLSFTFFSFYVIHWLAINQAHLWQLLSKKFLVVFSSY